MASSRNATPALGQQNKITGGRHLIIFTIISIVLTTFSFRSSNGGVVGIVKGAFQTITMPVRMVGSAVLAPFEGLGNIMVNLTTDQGTLSELKAENERLIARNVELEEAEKTAERLQDLLNIKNAYQLNSVAARIISGSGDSWTSAVMLDRGSLSGVSAGMPVVDATGVIGQIVECAPATSTVRLASDENSSIAAMVQSTRAQGMLEGSVSGQLYLTLVSTDIAVAVGETVVTSGLDGVYPKGLPLGRITGVDHVSGALTYDITVEPFSQTRNYEEVLIVTSLTSDQLATEEDIAEADAQERGTAGAKDQSEAQSQDQEGGTDDTQADAVQTDEASSAGDEAEDTAGGE